MHVATAAAKGEHQLVSISARITVRRHPCGRPGLGRRGYPDAV